MGFFRKKKELNQSMLTQLSRIADSLEKSSQPTTDAANQEMVTQLNRIVEVIEKGNLTNDSEKSQQLVFQLNRVVEVIAQANLSNANEKSEVNEKRQALLVPLGKIVDTLERICQEMPNDNNVAQLAQLERIASAIELSLPKEKEICDLDKKKAAYALNLCLVSISQIIDYSDLYVLEQEYEGILNNLNLENMPKDDALLDILRQILDTITFFRIQEGERQFIEQQYQDAMKTAIWSAVPNCSVILACASPKAMLLSLLTQVGTGYMNYRKEKAKAGRDRERAQWELHKAAIEQFNGLRRELFTTAWKLADSYGFPDTWRLTESQIAQYNRVLMDPNLSRRLARMEDLEERFEAYPPFWYFKGNAALTLAGTNQEVFADLYATARNAYEKYFEINTVDNELLRTDPICAACALEYVSLMEDNERQLKVKYIERAIRSAGTHFDIWQMCAMAYLEMGEVEKAAGILRSLVCEGYNEKVNAQLLSTIYIAGHLKKNTNMDCFGLYKRLTTFTDAEMLLKWPENGTIEDQYFGFAVSRRAAFLKSYANFLCDYYSQKAKQFCLTVLDTADDRVTLFVKFAWELVAELNSFPNVRIDKSQFAELMNKKKDEIDKLIAPYSKANNKVFELIFGDVFLAAVDCIASTHISTMEDISDIEVRLERAISSYLAGKAHLRDAEEVEPEYTLDALYNVDKEHTDIFLKIKDEVKRRKLLKENVKHIELLISGSSEYYRYIKDHGLADAGVVAVINDKTIDDCDLLITERGLLVHHGQSTASKVTRGVLLAATGGIYALALETVIKMFKDVVPYSEVTYNAKKLQKPNYSNKKIDMTQLIELVSACSTLSAGTIEEKMRTRILMGKPIVKSELLGDIHSSMLQGKTRTEKVNYCMAIMAVAVYFGQSIGDVTPLKTQAIQTTALDLLNRVTFARQEQDEIKRMVAQQLHYSEMEMYLDRLPNDCLVACERKMEEILHLSENLYYEEAKEKQRLLAYIADRTK